MATDRPDLRHLLTPRDWQAEALHRANKLAGTFEGALALVEAKRYGALADEIHRLRLLLLAAGLGRSADATIQGIVRIQGLWCNRDSSHRSRT